MNNIQKRTSLIAFIVVATRATTIVSGFQASRVIKRLIFVFIRLIAVIATPIVFNLIIITVAVVAIFKALIFMADEPVPVVRFIPLSLVRFDVMVVDLAGRAQILGPVA